MKVICSMETLAEGYSEDFQVIFETVKSTTDIHTFLTSLTMMTVAPETTASTPTDKTTEPSFLNSNISLKSQLETSTRVNPLHNSTRRQYATAIPFFGDTVNISVVSLLSVVSGLGSCGIMIYYVRNRLCKGTVMATR